MVSVDHSSILVSIKRMLGITPDDPAFDDEIIMHINGAFMTLLQLGIGPENGFSISCNDDAWSDFTTDVRIVDTVRMYIYLRVKVIFDPPSSSVAIEAMNSRIAELEWRLNVQAEGDAES